MKPKYTNSEQHTDNQYILATNKSEEAHPVLQMTHTVTSVSTLIKTILEQSLSRLIVRGEISGLKIAASGHVYFNLKDETSVIACVCWKYVFNSLNVKVEDGLEITVHGKLTIYSNQSKYQITVDKIDDLGLGALMKLFQERKDRLEREGVFSQKRTLPYLPYRIGLVTSRTGAVIKDMITRVESRFPCHIYLWHTAVQGKGAAEDIAAAISGFNNMADDKPEILIIARGGGSLEDLWAFNEEIVVRAIFGSGIPTISAIGHETDFTLADFAADVRASTPTAAIEIALPVRQDLQNRLDATWSKVKTYYQKHQRLLISQLYASSIYLERATNWISTKQQHIDFLGFKLMQPKNLDLFRSKLSNFHNVANQCFNIINWQIDKLERYKHNNAIDKIDAVKAKLKTYGMIIDSMQVTNILQKGFSIARVDGRIIKSKALPKGEVELEFCDGKVKLTKL